MGTKTITIMDDAYELLKQEKAGKESFSDVIRKIAPKKKSIWDFVGILNDKEADELHKIVEDGRKKKPDHRMKEILEMMSDDMP